MKLLLDRAAEQTSTTKTKTPIWEREAVLGACLKIYDPEEQQELGPSRKRS